ncbi:MAG: hypothetical protein GXO88_02210 [Chlorobi bacterium]|nr:hypothetical protein [Chlorobiota bacterium]
MKKIILVLSVLIIAVSSNSYSQFGIQNRIKNKYKEMGKKHAEEGLNKAEDKAEEKGMEEADKGLNKATDAAAPGIKKGEEKKKEGEEYVNIGLGKYQEFVDGYDEKVESKDPADYKRYSFESAIVEYSINDSKTERKEIYIDMGGYKYAEYDYVKKKRKTHKTAEILIGSNMISIDFEEESAVQVHNPAAFYLANPNRDWEESSKRILEHMGYEMIGHETIMKKDCEIWKQGSHRMWIWNGLALKIKNGRNIELATKLTVDEAVPGDVFEVPEGFEFTAVDAKSMFPDLSDTSAIKGDQMSEEEWNALLDDIENMSYSEYKAKVLEEDPGTDEESIRQAYLYLRQEARLRHK